MGDQRILFDTGAGTALQPNARHLGIDLACANSLVLSHGHYDHTGGLPGSDHKPASTFVLAGMAVPRYSCHPGIPPRDIGLRPDDYRSLCAVPMNQAHELHAPHYLAQGIGLTGPDSAQASHRRSTGSILSVIPVAHIEAGLRTYNIYSPGRKGAVKRKSTPAVQSMAGESLKLAGELKIERRAEKILNFIQ